MVTAEVHTGGAAFELLPLDLSSYDIQVIGHLVGLTTLNSDGAVIKIIKLSLIHIFSGKGRLLVSSEQIALLAERLRRLLCDHFLNADLESIQVSSLDDLRLQECTE